MSRIRRPTSLRGEFFGFPMFLLLFKSFTDVDLNYGPNRPIHSYPAPLTGHELMALFPPIPILLLLMLSVSAARL